MTILDDGKLVLPVKRITPQSRHVTS